MVVAAYVLLAIYLFTHETPTVWVGFTLLLIMLPIILRNRVFKRK